MHLLADVTITGIHTCTHAQPLSCVQVLGTPWTVAHQAPMFTGSPRQEYRSGLPFLPPGHLPRTGITPASPALPGGFFSTEPPGNPTNT